MKREKLEVDNILNGSGSPIRLTVYCDFPNGGEINCAQYPIVTILKGQDLMYRNEKQYNLEPAIREFFNSLVEIT